MMFNIMCFICVTYKAKKRGKDLKKAYDTQNNTLLLVWTW